ncbi:MAG: DUF1266 domain-containing protein [Deltaproteobacteria bacterium]|nr:DUF1266 domain-containing protein [Deltaproteobacteria bacterium]
MFSKKKQLTSQQLFGLAVGGVLTAGNGERFDRLATRWGRFRARKMLKDSWDIENTADVYETFRWLFEEGHRTVYSDCVDRVICGNTILDDETELSVETCHVIRTNLAVFQTHGFDSWDFSRLIIAARFAFSAKFIDESAAWKWIILSAHEIQKSSTSWFDSGRSFMNGFLIWSSMLGIPEDTWVTQAYRRLHHSPDSVWRNIDWNTKLNPDGWMQSTVDTVYRGA